MRTPDVPTACKLAMAWLHCGSAARAGPGATAARVTVLEAVNSAQPDRYFRRAANPGRAMDMGNSSGTRFASLSASSYST
jgi:hypothetical protein